MLTAFFQTEVGSLVYLTLLAAFANFAFGVWAAVRDGTFQLSAVAAFIRKDILGRVTPIFGLLGLGFAVGLTPNPPGLAAYAPAVFTLAGTAVAVIYIAEVFGRILDKLRPEKLPELTPEEKAAGVQVLSATRTPQD
jgi:hypothetical protein